MAERLQVPLPVPERGANWQSSWEFDASRAIVYPTALVPVAAFIGMATGNHELYYTAGALAFPMATMITRGIRRDNGDWKDRRERRERNIKFYLEHAASKLGQHDFTFDTTPEAASALNQATQALYKAVKKSSSGYFDTVEEGEFKGEVRTFAQRKSDTVARKMTVALGTHGIYDRMRVVAEDIDVIKPVTNPDNQGQDGVYALDVLFNKDQMRKKDEPFVDGIYFNMDVAQVMQFAPLNGPNSDRAGFVHGLQNCLLDLAHALKEPTEPPPPAKERHKLMHWPTKTVEAKAELAPPAAPDPGPTPAPEE